MGSLRLISGVFVILVVLLRAGDSLARRVLGEECSSSCVGDEQSSQGKTCTMTCPANLTPVSENELTSVVSVGGLVAIWLSTSHFRVYIRAELTFLKLIMLGPPHHPARHLALRPRGNIVRFSEDRLAVMLFSSERRVPRMRRVKCSTCTLTATGPCSPFLILFALAQTPDYAVALARTVTILNALDQLLLQRVRRMGTTCCTFPSLPTRVIVSPRAALLFLERLFTTTGDRAKELKLMNLARRALLPSQHLTPPLKSQHPNRLFLN